MFWNGEHVDYTRLLFKHDKTKSARFVIHVVINNTTTQDLSELTKVTNQIVYSSHKQFKTTLSDLVMKPAHEDFIQIQLGSSII